MTLCHSAVTTSKQHGTFCSCSACASWSVIARSGLAHLPLLSAVHPTVTYGQSQVKQKEAQRYRLAAVAAAADGGGASDGDRLYQQMVSDRSCESAPEHFDVSSAPISHGKCQGWPGRLQEMCM
jgi:hypothetical protein